MVYKNVHCFSHGDDRPIRAVIGINDSIGMALNPLPGRRWNLRHCPIAELVHRPYRQSVLSFLPVPAGEAGLPILIIGRRHSRNGSSKAKSRELSKRRSLIPVVGPTTFPSEDGNVGRY